MKLVLFVISWFHLVYLLNIRATEFFSWKLRISSLLLPHQAGPSLACLVIAGLGSRTALIQQAKNADIKYYPDYFIHGTLKRVADSSRRFLSNHSLHSHWCCTRQLFFGCINAEHWPTPDRYPIWSQRRNCGCSWMNVFSLEFEQAKINYGLS